ncbi:MAG: hypothetical protein MJ078_05740, partial [Clostridia bacterium]|nr:hypothetical protein [Clostridia bacterium]
MRSSVRKVYVLFFVLTFLFAAGISALCGITAVSHYDAEKGFLEKSLIPDLLLPVFLLTFAALCLTAFLFLSRKIRRFSLPLTPALRAFSLLGTLAFLFWFISYGTDFAKGLYASCPLLLNIAFPLLSLGIFFLFAAVALKANASLCAIGSMAAAVFAAVYAVYVRFEPFFAIHHPVKMFDQFTFIVLSLYFFFFFRYHLGFGNGAFYFPAAMFAAVLTSADGLSGLLYFAVKGEPLLCRVAHDVLLFALSLYLFARLASVFHRESSADTADPYALEFAVSRKSDETVPEPSLQEEEKEAGDGKDGEKRGTEEDAFRI